MSYLMTKLIIKIENKTDAEVNFAVIFTPSNKK